MGETSAYRTVMKGTALFGGVQAFQILISLIRGKMTAILIGADGVGVSSVYVSSLAMIITFASLGCNLSAVKYISGYEKKESDYIEKINMVHNVFLWLSMFGVLITVSMSAYLSQISFQSDAYCWSYVVLAGYVGSSIYSSGCVSILQGMQELNRIAIGNVLPGLLGLCFTIPIYYYWGIDGVVCALVIMPLISSVILHKLLTKIYAQYKSTFCFTGFRKIRATLKEYSSLGFITVMANLFGNITVYCVNASIGRLGSFRDIGLYQAGTSITNQYIGLVFSAMSMDYLPRLSRGIECEEDTNATVNYQGEIVTLVTLPLLAVMMVSAPLLIKVLLSEDFLEVTQFIRVMAFGMLIQALYFPMSYLPYAKGDKLVLFILEGIVANVVHYVLLVASFYYYGLIGAATAHAVQRFLGLIQTVLLGHYRYKCKISGVNIRLSMVSLLGLGILWCLTGFQSTMGIVLSLSFTVLVCFWSIWQLNNRVDLIDVLKRMYNERNCHL